MDKAYYIEYFDLERNHWWFRARSLIIRNHISSVAGKGGKKILNIGAATGGTSEMLAGFGEVTSLEYDQDCCRFVKEKLNKDFICASITRLPFDKNTYDIVCAFDVIEHVDDHCQAAAEMLRVCRPGGAVVCTVPAYSFLWSHHDVVNHHVRRYTMNELSALFQKDSRIIYKTYFNFFLFPVIALLRLADRVLKLKSIRKDAGSDFSIIKHRFINGFFYQVMRAENFFVKRRISLPFGVSILLSVIKKADEK
jgi:SAM-dependent methyltransferase